MNTSSSADPTEYYTNEQKRHEEQLRENGRNEFYIRSARLLAAVIGVACAVAGWIGGGFSPWYLGTALAFGGLVALAFWHQKLLEQSQVLRLRVKMCRQQLARIARNWKQIKMPSPSVPTEHRAEAQDLDLSGNASLFELACCAFTPIGVETFQQWLLNPASPDEIQSRQQAVQLLAPNRSLRERLELHGRLLQQGSAGPEAFLAWAEGSPFLHHRPALIWLARGLTLTVLVAAVLLAFFVSPVVMCFIILGVIIINVVLNVLFAGSIHDLFNKVSSRNNSIQHYRQLLALISELPDDCEFFERLKSSMGKSVSEPLAILNQLHYTVKLADARRDPLFGVFYLATQVVLLTDFHVLSLLEHWQMQHGGKVRSWLEAIAKLEAVSSLATLSHDNTKWCFPEVKVSDQPTLAATQIGHPLLPPTACVRNDVQVGPPGSFLLVTGSNMSGKSTLLRSVGVNVALAQAGGPVCAESMRLPPLELATSMRVTDSLAEGVSFFMAELKRLKQIVDRSSETSQDESRTLLFILDEILQGTNSAERHIAVSRVVSRLVSDGSLGLVSTHDLELASATDLAAACNAVHFRETISTVDGKKEMTFDYAMREGVAPTTNALKLLEIVGLE